MSISIMVQRMGKGQIAKVIKKVEHFESRVIQRMCDRVLQIATMGLSKPANWRSR